MTFTFRLIKVWYHFNFSGFSLVASHPLTGIYSYSKGCQNYLSPSTELKITDTVRGDTPVWSK